MSGASIPCCRICGNKIGIVTDYLEHILMEESFACLVCGLYSYQYLTGSSEYTLGFKTWYGHYTDDPSADERRAIEGEKSKVDRETRALYSDPEWVNWKWIVDKSIELDSTDFKVFADWLGEKGFTENERIVREMLEGSQESTKPICEECGGSGYGIYGQPSNTPCYKCNP